MQVAIGAPKRPALRYYGGKWRLGPWIISHFPEHKSYIEPCGGAASVLLQKPRSTIETYNDLDGNVVNFFRVLRDYPEVLRNKIFLTPWARAEYELSLQPPHYDGGSGWAIEAARRFFVCHMLGVKQSMNTTSGQFRLCTDEGLVPILNNPELSAIAERFIGVQIESMPYDYVIEKCDRPDSLIYFDPPYVDETRTHNDVYMVEFTESDHIAAANLLRNAAGYVVVSGYACSLYADLYEAHGWHRVDKEAQTNSGGKRIESLWLSPRTVEALAKPQQSGLFA